MSDAASAIVVVKNMRPLWYIKSNVSVRGAEYIDPIAEGYTLALNADGLPGYYKLIYINEGWPSFWKDAQAQKKAGKYDNAVLYDTWEECITDGYEGQPALPSHYIIEPRQWYCPYYWNGTRMVPKNPAKANARFASVHRNCTSETCGHPVPYEPWPDVYLPWAE